MNILLYMRDEQYGEKLLTAFCEKEQGENVFSLITRESMLEEWKHKADCILSDQMRPKDVETRWMWLCEQPNQDGIYRYQRASKILEAVVGRQISTKERPCNWVGVFGVDGISGSQAAAEMTEMMAKKGKTVYLNLTSLPTLLEGEYPEGMKGLSELLFGERLEETSFAWKGALAVYPFAHYMDLMDLRGEEVANLLQQLQTREQVEYVVVEMSQLWEGMLDVMACLDQIYLVGKDTAMNRIKIGVFKRYCRVENRENLIGKMVTAYER